MRRAAVLEESKRGSLGIGLGETSAHPARAMPRYDLAVIGGGIMGLSHAAAALARGLSVALFERGPAVTEASVRNFGLLTSLYDGGGQWGDRALRSRELYRAWSARGGCPLSHCGSLQLAQTPLQWALLQAYAAAAPRLRYPVALLDARAARARLPALQRHPSVLGALHFPEDALLEPRVMFDREGGLPAALARAGLALHWATPIVALRRSEGSGGDGGSEAAHVELRSASGQAFTARRAVLCAGADVHALAPALFASEAPRLRLCKLQMMRLLLEAPEGGGLADGGGSAGGGAALPPPCTVTSGLSLRRYPGPAAVCPAEHAALLAGEQASAAAQALGIHVIARPAAALPRTAFDAVDAGAAAAAAAAAPLQLSQREWIVGDSHEYWPLARGSAAPAHDESCSEAVTDEILKVTAGMLQGVEGLLQARGAAGSAGSAGSSSDARAPRWRARLLQQWSGTYLDHAEGFFSAAASIRGGEVARLPEAQAAARRGGTVHIATGIGGKGMTMSPALGEEFVARYYP